MINKTIKCKIKSDELDLLREVINEGLSELTLYDKKDRQKILVMSILQAVSIKFSKKLCENKSSYSISLSTPEAQALVIAYQKEYINSPEENKWASLILMRRCNELDKITA